MKDFKIRFQLVKDFPSKELKSLIDQGKKDLKKDIVIAYTIVEGKVGIAVGVTNELTKKYNAVELVKLGSKVIGGTGGGGRNDFAQAGGEKIEKIDLKQATKSASEAQESVAWKKIVANAIQETLSGLSPGDVVFVVRSSTTAKEGSYFPFFESIQAVIESSTVESGFNIPIEQPLDSGYYVETDFELENSGVSMTPRVQEAKNGKVVATKTIGLSATELPKSWSDRNLQDIAHELTKKLTRSRFLAFRKNVPVEFGEIVGGELSDPSHVTDFSILMRGYIEDEISKLVRIRLVGEDSKKKTHSLKGVYHVIDSNVELRLTLRNLKSGSAKANAASSFSRTVVPAGVSVLP